MARIFIRVGLSRSGRFGALVVGLMYAIATTGASAQGENPPKTAKLQEKKFMNEVSGEFDVKITPADTGDDKMGMMLLDKKYHGDLSGSGVGRMLTGMTEVKTSGVYVAIERVKGKLKGAEGSFLVHHTGIMAQGKQSLSIKVVPDSGTGEFVGIEGEMHIKIADGKHFYRFEYTLGEKR